VTQSTTAGRVAVVLDPLTLVLGTAVLLPGSRCSTRPASGCWAGWGATVMAIRQRAVKALPLVKGPVRSQSRMARFTINGSARAFVVVVGHARRGLLGRASVTSVCHGAVCLHPYVSSFSRCL